MPITVSYDLTAVDTNERTYIRSMFERFGWKRLGDLLGDILIIA
jgi:hypothetical protein